MRDKGIQFWLVAVVIILGIWFLIPGKDDNVAPTQTLVTKTLPSIPSGNTPAGMVVVPAVAGQPEEVVFSQEKIFMQTVKGRLPLNVAVPQNLPSMEFGMMNRDHWPENIHGMLFPFTEEAVQSMWMKDTYLPLDMVFMDKTGKVVKIVENTIPKSEAKVSSVVPVMSILEIPAGSSKQWGLAIGDTMLLPAQLLR